MNKGKKNKGQAFIPGKGLRNKKEEQEMLLSLSNPAQLGKGKSTGGGKFVPGKGIRKNEETLLALSNPAQLGKGKSTGEFRSFLG